VRSCASCFYDQKTGSKLRECGRRSFRLVSGFGRSRNTLRWATGENEVSECLTEVAGIGAVASASIREGGGHDVIWCPVARLGSHSLLAPINL
jgi:hypothetical protein